MTPGVTMTPFQRMLEEVHVACMDRSPLHAYVADAFYENAGTSAPPTVEEISKRVSYDSHIVERVLREVREIAQQVLHVEKARA